MTGFRKLTENCRNKIIARLLIWQADKKSSHHYWSTGLFLQDCCIVTEHCRTMIKFSKDNYYRKLAEICYQSTMHVIVLRYKLSIDNASREWSRSIMHDHNSFNEWCMLVIYQSMAHALHVLVIMHYTNIGFTTQRSALLSISLCMLHMCRLEVG